MLNWWPNIFKTNKNITHCFYIVFWKYEIFFVHLVLKFPKNNFKYQGVIFLTPYIRPVKGKWIIGRILDSFLIQKCMIDFSWLQVSMSTYSIENIASMWFYGSFNKPFIGYNILTWRLLGLLMSFIPHLWSFRFRAFSPLAQVAWLSQLPPVLLCIRDDGFRIFHTRLRHNFPPPVY